MKTTVETRCAAWAAWLAAGVLVAGCAQKKEEAPAAGSVKPPAAATVAGVAGAGMAAIPAGGFTMGDDHGDADEKPSHEVKIDAFLMDTREVTQQRYQAVMGKNPSKYKGPDHPVDQVSWFDAIQYCNRLSTKEGLKPCYDLEKNACDFAANGYRLPTEAEWEYACRAGSRTRFSFGDEASKLGLAGWFKDNASATTHPVGQKAPNAWGLCDMHGNVAEWCQDFYSENAYAAAKPRGPAAGDICVLRGGSWKTAADACRSSARNSETPRFVDACFGADAIGFRVVRKAPDPQRPATPRATP